MEHTIGALAKQMKLTAWTMLMVESTMDAAGKATPTLIVCTPQLTTSMEQLIGAPGKPLNLVA